MPDAVLLDGEILESKPALFKKTAGGLGGGGGAQLPHFQKQRLSHGRMIFEAVLCVSKKARVGVDATPHPFASRMPAS